MYKIEGVYIKKGRAKELLAKEKKEFFLGHDIFFGGLRGREWQGFYGIDCLSFLWGMEKAHVADDLVGADWKTPD